MSSRLLLLAWLVALAVGAACAAPASDDAMCVFRDTRPCECGGLEGTQHCKWDGSAWGTCAQECDCESGTARVYCSDGAWPECECGPSDDSGDGDGDSGNACPEFGEIECDGQCVSVFGDENCGACGVVCPPETTCFAVGQCIIPCYVGWQDCPGGMKCTGYVMTQGYCCVDGNKCVDVIGDQNLGDPCWREDDNDDCARGLFCMPVTTSGGNGPGVCLTLCDASDPGSCAAAGQPEGNCNGFSDGVLPLCYDACDPISQDTCADSRGCYPLGHVGFTCLDPGAKLDGETCDGVAECSPGLACLDGADQAGCAVERCCSPMCDCTNPADPACTDPSEECVCLFEAGDVAPEYADIGSCRTP